MGAPRAVQVIRYRPRAGFGHDFERPFATFAHWLEDSPSHHRVLEHELGDLRMGVRFEVDASCSKRATMQHQSFSNYTTVFLSRRTRMRMKTTSNVDE